MRIVDLDLMKNSTVWFSINRAKQDHAISADAVTGSTLTQKESGKLAKYG